MLPEELPSAALGLDGLIDLELRASAWPSLHPPKPTQLPVPDLASYLPNAIIAQPSALSGRGRSNKGSTHPSFLLEP
ncbi:uncharacterized [Tachysurus ichikawai]